MRLIDADALDILYEDGDTVCIKNLDTQPTIDAVEVVRCGECRRNYLCPIYVFGGRDKEFYCGAGAKMDGERRTE